MVYVVVEESIVNLPSSYFPICTMFPIGASKNLCCLTNATTTTMTTTTTMISAYVCSKTLASPNKFGCLWNWDVMLLVWHGLLLTISSRSQERDENEQPEKWNETMRRAHTCKAENFLCYTLPQHSNGYNVVRLSPFKCSMLSATHITLVVVINRERAHTIW